MSNSNTFTNEIVYHVLQTVNGTGIHVCILRTHTYLMHIQTHAQHAIGWHEPETLQHHTPVRMIRFQSLNSTRSRRARVRFLPVASELPISRRLRSVHF